VKSILKAILLPAAVLCVLCTTTASSHAQTTFNAIGSSALFLELGEAAYSNNSASCAWSTSTKDVVATDTSTGASLSDAGTAWAVWVPSSGNTCASNATPATLYGYLNTDSVVGDRCLFNAQAGRHCSISYSAAAGAAPSGLIEGSKEVSLPSAVASSLTSSIVNAAGTDIRPEDAEFAVTRALTPCGSSTTEGGGSIAPYLGLGYSNGGSILSHFSGSSFNVINFALPSTFFVQPVGVDPIVVTVNSTDPSGTGFNIPGTASISRAALAGYLDGSIGTTGAAAGKGQIGVAKPSTVIVREPLSGTYNTMEYNIPNSRAYQTSQDVGVNQLSSQVNCSGSVPASNPMAIENATAGSFRYRAIGTGQELSETFATNDALGYAFWGLSNFAAAPATSKYLMVDTIDPILTTYHEGVIPTTQAELNGITFEHILDGSYPIWSLLRIVTVDTTTRGTAKTLAIAAAQFSTVSATGTSHPDFVTYYNTKGQISLNLERSHFAPPGISFPGSNGIADRPGNGGVSFYNGQGACTATEAGGDVGGTIIPIAYTDQSYCTDTGTVYGILNRRF
jgi:hypothetical protein